MPKRDERIRSALRDVRDSGWWEQVTPKQVRAMHDLALGQDGSLSARYRLLKDLDRGTKKLFGVSSVDYSNPFAPGGAAPRAGQATAKDGNGATSATLEDYTAAVNRDYTVAVETGMKQASARLEELGVVASQAAWSGAGDPIASPEAVSTLQREGAEATLDARDRLSGTSFDVETVLDIARSLEAAPWDKGRTRDDVYSDLADACARVGISNGAVRDQIDVDHENDEDWRAADSTASWVAAKSDLERLEAVSGRVPKASESTVESVTLGRAESHSSRRASYPQSPTHALSRAAGAASGSVPAQPQASVHSAPSAGSHSAPGLER
ncbi:hypothetical protein ITJ38_17475 [Agreia pratensis]|uniref:hypothetical protein n=1 Tax=Agreia pratensis TaxID=150121 RepID=UPI00188A4AC5|nr:hypothetical protein [Agreia pratensis]MBF4636204.1 hypothetical protein [Agreia pratensis]